MKHHFENGWTASVIDNGYGSQQGLFEVWAWNDGTGERDEDVQGWLTQEQVDRFLAEVAARGTGKEA